MKIDIEFHTDNVVFEDSFLMEVTMVTRSIKEALLDSENTTTIRRPIRDSNRNRIGVISISRDTHLLRDACISTSL
jgi:hypothetical protein